MTHTVDQLPEAKRGDAVNTATLPIVVLDTSVICAEPESLIGFPSSEVVVPLTVVEELDEHKTRRDDVGRAAREALRQIEAIRVANGGDVRKAVLLAHGGTIRVETNGLHISRIEDMGLHPSKNDNRILAACLGLTESGRPVTVVSNDTGMRIKAAQIGLAAEEYRRVSEAPKDLWPAFDVHSSVVDELYHSKHLELDDIDGADTIPENGFAVVRSGQSQSAIVRRTKGTLVPLPQGQSAYDLHPRSKEQKAALALLLDPAVQVVALDGPAGTGKTLAALAAALQQTVEDGKYDRVAVYRPIVSVGKAELGFLPGDLEDKLSPWMSAITDAVSALMEDGGAKTAEKHIEDLTAMGKLSMESVTFLRGRTLHKAFVIVDEAQNLEPMTLKTILTRIGEGSKVVFTGDQSQIDAPYMSEYNNALAVLVDAFSGQELFGHVRLSSVERGSVASLAAELL